MQEPKYPEFTHPRQYMRKRVSTSIGGRAKEWAERRAIDRCLAHTSRISTLCDVPAGPGRLFPLWKSKGLAVWGLDYSESMVKAAKRRHAKLSLEGEVGRADAFHLVDALPEKVDLVASVRFVYYFDRDRRVELLKALAAASQRYVLVQYRTSDTLKGRIRNLRAGLRNRPEHMQSGSSTNEQVIEEVRQAGLIPLRIDPIGTFSDRVFVLAEKPVADQLEAIKEVQPVIRQIHSWSTAVVALLFLLLALLYSLNIADRSFWGENEAFYSLGAESVLRGHWIVPMINPDLPADKPPLMFWWIALISSLFGGVQEWTARLANMLPALGTLGILYGFARKRINPGVALLATMILGTSYEFWENARGVGTDMLLLFLLTGALATMLKMIEKPFRWRRCALFWSLLGLATLTKGPVALVLPASIAVAYAVWRFGWQGAWRALMRLRPFTGGLIALGPMLLWTTAVAVQAGGGPLETILVKHNIQRFLSAFDHQRPWYYYITELPLNMLPWSLLLPFIAWSLVKNKRERIDEPAHGTRRDRHALGYALVATATIFLFFSLSSSKRDYYLLPLMPWGALLIGHWFSRVLTRKLPATLKKWRDEGVFGAALLGQRWGRTVILVFVLTFISFASYGGFVTDWLDKRKTPEPFAAAIAKNVDDDDLLIILNNKDPRYWFYLSPRFSLIDDDTPGIAMVQALLDSGRDIDLLVRKDDLQDLPVDPTAPLYVQAVHIYRDKPVYHLTNESGFGLAKFTPPPKEAE